MMKASKSFAHIKQITNVAIVTNIAPLYREALWTSLMQHKQYRFHFFFGYSDTHGIKCIDFRNDKFNPHRNQLHPVKNRYIMGKRLVWQSGLLRAISKSKAKTIILVGDMWVPTNWLLAIISRFKKRQVIFWSHGLYGNESIIKKKMRVLFYKLANAHLLYERRGKKLMEKAGFDNEKLHVVFNSLDYTSHLKNRNALKANIDKKVLFSFFKNPNLPVAVFVGRLTKIKRIDLLLDAVSRINKTESRVNTLIIGDGSERKHLEKLASEYLKKGLVHFYGACYSENELSKIITASDLCVSPGNVGLTAIHSLSYGTPVCTHNNFENQMPEVEAITDGYNGVFFEEENVLSLAQHIEKWIFQNPLTRNDIRLNCYKVIDDYYNPSYQCSVIENLLVGGKPLI